MKPMKKKRVSKIARGRFAKSQVWKGTKEKTTGKGLKKADLLKSQSSGRVISKKKSAFGKKMFAHIAPWVAAVKAARAELGLTGFVAIKKGTPLYAKAKELLAAGTLAPCKLLRRGSTKELA